MIWLYFLYRFYINKLPKEAYKIVQRIAIFNYMFFTIELKYSKSCAKQVNNPIFILFTLMNCLVKLKEAI